MKRITVIILLLAMALSLCACSSNEPTEPALPVYTVKVVDESGAPVAGVVVQWCSETCFPGVTDAEGTARYTAPEADYHVQINAAPAGYAADTREYSYSPGTYELTIILKAA